MALSLYEKAKKSLGAFRNLFGDTKVSADAWIMAKAIGDLRPISLDEQEGTGRPTVLAMSQRPIGEFRDYYNNFHISVDAYIFAQAIAELRLRLFTGESAGGGGNYQPLSIVLTTIAGLSTTPFGRGLLTLALPADLRNALALGPLATLTDPAAMRAALGLGSVATLNTITANQIQDGSITNAKINSAAGIAFSKMAFPGGSATDQLLNGAGQFVFVTSANIQDGSLVNADISPTAAIAFSKMAFPGGTSTFLRADGNFAALPTTLPAWLNGITSLVINDDDELELIKGGITFVTQLTRKSAYYPTADSTDITADSTEITADAMP